MTLIVSFDPGVGNAMPGGMCIMHNGEVVAAYEMMRAGKIVDVPAILRWIDSEAAFIAPTLVVVEKQHARPQDSHASMNVALPAYGQLVGMCQAMRWNLQIVDPKAWKRVVLTGTKRDKDAACAHVARRYPNVDLRPGRRRKAHDGIADAVCIGEWGHQHASNPKQGAS